MSDELVRLDFQDELCRLARSFSPRPWLVDEVRRWLDGSARFCLVVGGPGSGKSAFAASLIRELDEVWAHNLCIFGRRSTLSPRSVARSIAAQLIARTNDFATALTNAIAPTRISISGHAQAETAVNSTVVGVNIGSIAGLDPETEFELLLRAPLTSLAPPAKPMCILVDGLDEAMHDRSPNLVDLLSRVDDYPPWVRFLLTTRPDRSIVRAFQGACAIDLDRRSIEAAADVERYLNDRINRHAKDKADAIRRSGGARRIAQAAGSNFLYAQLIAEDFEANEFSDADEIPDSLEAAYARFLTRWSAATWESLHPLMRVMAAARAPLNEAQLAMLLKRPRDDIRRALGSAGQFLQVEDRPGGKIYQLFHHSFREYLTDAEANPDFWCSEIEGASTIAQTYLDILDRQGADALDQYAIEHLPAHLFHAGMTDAAVRLLSNLDFIRVSLEARLDTPLSESYQVLATTLPQRQAKELEDIGRFLRANAITLTRRPTLLVQEVLNGPASLPLRESAERVLAAGAAGPLVIASGERQSRATCVLVIPSRGRRPRIG